MTIKNIFRPRNIVLMHGWSRVGNVPTFIWRQGNDWLLRLYGLTMDVKSDPDTKNLYVQAEPVYAPFFRLERHPGQIILDIHAWTSSCVTINLTEKRPWIWITHTSKFLYKEADE
jgi:hypothetical protein